MFVHVAVFTATLSSLLIPISNLPGEKNPGSIIVEKKCLKLFCKRQMIKLITES